MKLFRSFANAFRGIREFVSLGANAKIQVVAAIAILSFGFALGFDAVEWMAVAICIGFVLSAEAMNTAIEELANEVTEERRERIRRVKDIAAGAVLIASITALAVFVLLVSKRL